MDEILHYDLESGLFTWKCTISRHHRIGEPAGTIRETGKLVITVGDKRHSAEKLAFTLQGYPEPFRVRHLNGDLTDNRWINLQAVEKGQHKPRVREYVSRAGAGPDSGPKIYNVYQYCSILGNYPTAVISASEYEHQAKGAVNNLKVRNQLFQLDQNIKHFCLALEKLSMFHWYRECLAENVSKKAADRIVKQLITSRKTIIPSSERAASDSGENIVRSDGKIFTSAADLATALNMSRQMLGRILKSGEKHGGFSYRLVTTKASKLTREDVLAWLHYDPNKGIFTYKAPRGNCAAGPVAGSRVGNRLCINIEAQPYPVHKLVWLMETSVYPVGHLTHLDGDTLNNLFANLKLRKQL